MAWSTIRKATTEDRERLNAAAERFIARHGLEQYTNQFDGMSPWWAVDFMLHQTEAVGRDTPYVRRLWRKALRRALRSPDADGIAYDYIGFYV